MKSLLSLCAALPVIALISCSPSGSGDPNYDTTDPYGIPGQQAAATPEPAATEGVESGTYQPLTPGAAAAPASATAAHSTNPTYAPAVYEDNTTSPSAAAPVKRTTTSSANHVMADERAPRATSGGSVHTVVKGDSLWSIGKKYGVSVTALKTTNNLTKDTVILGQKIRIPAH